MIPRKQEFVVFYSPGSFFDESSSRPIDSRDTKLAMQMAAEIVESKPYGFRFETRIVADPIPDGQGGTLKVESKVIDETGTYFISGALETADDVEARNDPKEDILRSNMRSYPIVCAIHNGYGYRSVQPFEEQNVLVNAAGEIVERGDDPKWVAYRAKKKTGQETLFRSKAVKVEVEK